MESGHGGEGRDQWRFRPNSAGEVAGRLSVRRTVLAVMANMREGDDRAVVPLGHGDPSHFPAFRTAASAAEAVAEAVASAKYNCYAPYVGVAQARK